MTNTHEPHLNKNSIEFTLPNSIELIDETIEEIKKIPKELSAEEIHKSIQNKITLTLMWMQELSNEILRTAPIFRARPVTNQKINENDFQEFSYPPDPTSINIGRANLPGQQVFYSSADPLTPFIEIQQKIIPNETTVYLSKWRIKQCNERVLMRTHFLGVETNGFDDSAAIMAEHLNEIAWQQFQSMPDEMRDRFKYMQTKYVELFRAAGDEFYHLTSAIANDTFHTSRKQGVNIHLMTYPSVAQSLRSVNFVFRKDFVDEYFEPEYVDKVIVREISNEKVLASPIARGIPFESGIDWLPFQIKIVELDWGKTLLCTLNQFRQIRVNERITTCCVEHSKSVQDFVGDLKKHEEKLLSAVKELPGELCDGKNSVETKMELIVELHGAVFGTEDISPDKNLKSLHIPMRCKMGYFKD